MNAKKVVFTGGGTGGHVYPNVAIYERLKESYPDSSFLYIGTRKGAENRIVKNLPEPIDFEHVLSRGIPQKIKSLQTLFSLAYIFLGTVKSFFLLRKFKPDIVIGSGGYVAAPVLFAASLLKMRVFVHEQNAVPGRMNQFIARFAEKIGVSFASTAQFFPPEKAVFTGYPLRKSLSIKKSDNIKEKYKIPEKNKVLFIFGGSTGARTINNAVAELIPAFLGMDDLTVILSTGRGYSKDYKAYDDTIKIFGEIGVPPEVEGKLIVREYFDNIDEIYSIADLVISRAGAGSIKEITTLGLPSILVPKIDLPGDHQILNAREVEKIGGARIVYEEVKYRDNSRTIFVPETKLMETIRETIYDSDLLFNMRKNLRQIEKQKSSELVQKEIAQIFKGKEKAEEKQVKIFYLHSPQTEKNMELVFNTTTLGNSFLCDQYIDNLDEDVMVDLKMLKDGEQIIARKKKGRASLNGKEIDDWTVMEEDSELVVGGQAFILKSYHEKVETIHSHKSTSAKILGSSLGIMISRFGGLFRQIIIAAYFGAFRAADIFIVGLTLSNFMRRIVAENALENAFLPIFNRLFHRSTRKRTWEASSSITNFTLVLSFLITVIGIIFTPWIVSTLFHSFAEKGMLQETIKMTRLIFPYLFLVTLASIFTTYLKAFNRFGLAESSAIFFSIGTIMGILVLHESAGLYSIGYGVLLGGFMQIIFLLPIMFRLFKNKSIGFSYKPVINFSSPSNKRYYSQLVPISIDVILARVTELVAVFLASALKTGSIAILNFAVTIYRLPFSVISQAVNSVILKEFSEKIALFDRNKAKRLFLDGIKTNIYLLTPISILMIVLASPIVSIILERGKFDAAQTAATAYALQFYSIGLIGWGIHALTVRVFSARLDIKTSMILNFFMLIVNVGLSILLVNTALDYAGLALATSISFMVFALIRVVVLKNKMEKEEIFIKYKEILVSFAKTLFSALLMVIVLIQAKLLMKEIAFDSRTIGNLVLLVSLSFIGISVYFLSSLMLKNTEVLIFKRKFLRKENNVPLSMLSPFRFLEKVSKNSDAYREDYLYKINIYTSSSSWEIRNVGIKLVGIFGDKSKAPYLKSILESRSENGFIRRNALISLKHLNIWNSETKKLLIDLLEDPYYEVRAAALDYLAKNSTVNDFELIKPAVHQKLKKSSIEEKLACLRIIAKIGDKEDLDSLKPYYLSSNSLIREGILEIVYHFYRRKILTADDIRDYIGNILITSNNMNPQFSLKKIIEKIYKEIEKG